MAFLRFNRDKRGYEHFYLVEASTNRRGKTRARVLYWFRTPPNVKVGREPFDEGVRRMLETQNPGVAFDWRKIVETPIPSADAERWRERRRAERADKAARRRLAAGAPGEAEQPVDLEEPPGDYAEDAAAEDAAAQEVEEQLAAADAVPLEAMSTEPVTLESAAPVEASAAAVAAPFVDAGPRRRRRRRRGRKGRGSPPNDAGAAPKTTEPTKPDGE